MDTMKPLKIKTSISLDEDISLKIHELADKDDRAFSAYINLVLRNHLRELEKEKH